ncbi:MAG: hypothetical protein KBC62_01880 [Candidatus Pacebacteria bacterium]|nr:hypothetical protein [Candidatus Paceibacterota bacterium]MBP9842731.1 hypothetical protein [Candidatus Paceibacterota bacterium]
MAVLRIETETVPARITKTTIISIPSKDWQRVELIRGLLLLSPFFLMIWLLGVTYILLTYFEQLQKHSDRSVIIFMATVTYLSSFFLIWKILGIFLKIRSNLLKKHGWDGESRYRVELESEQIVLHHDD